MRLCLLLLSLALLLEAIKIESYQKKSQDSNIIKLNANPASFMKSMWVMVLKADHMVDGALETMREDLVQFLTLDHCVLLDSAVTADQWTLRIYCNGTREEGWEGQEEDGEDGIKVQNKEEEPMPMQNTMDDFLLKHFPSEAIYYEKNKQIRQPHRNFMGSYDLMDYAMRREMGLQPRPQDHIQHLMMPSVRVERAISKLDFIESPAPWALDRIDQRAGMLNNAYDYIDTASDVDVYVVDTGVRVTHTEFQGRARFLVNTAGDAIDTDCAGHGTHVASLAAGVTYGAAKRPTIYGAKVLTCQGTGDLFTIQAGIMAVIEQAKVNTTRRGVINLSLGGSKSTLLDNAVATLTANNLVVSVSAGNDGVDACTTSPGGMGGVASYNVLTVGASDINDDKPVWSNDGSCVSLSAPGVDIIGAWFTSDGATQVLSGTSMATPYVTGVTALVLQQDLTLSVAQVKDLVLAWVTPNIIGFASIAGGGKNLLYSLIDTTQVIPTPGPVSPDPPSGPGGAPDPPAEGASDPPPPSMSGADPRIASSLLLFPFLSLLLCTML